MQDGKPSFITHSLRRTDQETQKDIAPQYADLYQAVKDAYKKENRDSLSLWMSVQAELRRYNLEKACPTSTVLHASFLRGIRAIDHGKPMPNPSAWIRLTCRNIIREKNRSKKKEAQLEAIDSLPEQMNEAAAGDDAFRLKHRKVKRNFQRLTPLDQAILTLKVIDGLRWSAVQIRLIDMGYKPYSLEALRKRKSRALQQLREDDYPD